MSATEVTWLTKIGPFELHWLAGLLEGEGSFLKGPPSAPAAAAVQLVMTDQDIVERVAAMWKLKAFRVRVNSPRPNWKPQFCVSIRGGRAVQLMKVLRPLMGERRRKQIDLAIACWDERPIKPPVISREAGRRISAALAAGVRPRDLAAEYGVTRWSIYAIGQQRYFPDQPNYASSHRSGRCRASAPATPTTPPPNR